MHAGDTCTFILLPQPDFDAENLDLIHFFSPRDFMKIGVPEVGAIMLFTTIDGCAMLNVMHAVIKDSIAVDFNYPLAGHQVIFDIAVLAINL